MVIMFYQFKSPSNTTGRDLHTYSYNIQHKTAAPTYSMYLSQTGTRCCASAKYWAETVAQIAQTNKK